MIGQFGGSQLSKMFRLPGLVRSLHRRLDVRTARPGHDGAPTRNLHGHTSNRGQRNHSRGDPKNEAKYSNRGTWLLAIAAAAPFPTMPESHNMTPMTPQGNPFLNPYKPPMIGWDTFANKLLARGEVEQVIISPNAKIVMIVIAPGAIVDGQRVLVRQALMQVPSVESFERKLRDFETSIGIRPGHGVPVTYQRSSPLMVAFSALAFIGIVYLFFKNSKFVFSGGPMNMMKSVTKAKFTLVDPMSRQAGADSIKFKDVAGLKEAKVEVMEFVDYLKNSDRFLKLGAKLPKGVLLTGPPGCGKTLLAKAVATEANVPFMAMSGSDFVEMIGGVGASRVRSLFKTAKKLAPCIIYIDEIDSIGKQRGGAEFYNTELDQTLNQLLVEMDGMVQRKSVILLASTNRADVLDKALLRPGRFDRQILIDLPNLEERREIFERHAAKVKLEKSPQDYSLRMAQLTPGMSGADLANVCNEAALQAARENRSAVTDQDLEYALERVIGGPVKKSSALSPEERRIIAYHESGHALTGWLLENCDPVLKVSILPRTSNVLGFAQYLPSDQKLYSPDQFLDRMCMALGGRVAELIKFNHLSTGAQDDLKRVTEIAMKQITEFGFDPVIGHISFPKEETQLLGTKPYSKRLANVIDQRATQLVTQAFEKTRQLLSANVDKLNLLAETLLKKEVINSNDIEQLIGPKVGRAAAKNS